MADGDGRLTTREQAAAADRTDPLRHFRGRLLHPEPELIYLDGNSLGRTPASTPARLAAVVGDEWAGGLVRSWDRWVDLPFEAGDRIAGLVGAAPGEVVVADSTTVNLYKLAAAALRIRGDRNAVVTDAGNFPSDLYVLEGLCADLGLELRVVERPGTEGIDGDVALVCFSHVDYRTAEVADLASVAVAAHEAGALVLFDLSHSAGAVPVDLGAVGADLAVGCTYKYLHGGPGAPAWLFVRAGLLPELRSPVWGWFGQHDQFAMAGSYDPAAGIARFLAGTPNVVGTAGVLEGAALVAEAGIGALRARSIELTDLAVERFDAVLAPLGMELASPRDSRRRGSHVSFRHPEAWRLCRALIDRHGVVPDFRTPDLVRFGLSPLDTTRVEVWDGVDRLAEALAGRQFEAYDPVPGRIT